MTKVKDLVNVCNTNTGLVRRLERQIIAVMNAIVPNALVKKKLISRWEVDENGKLNCQWVVEE